MSLGALSEYAVRLAPVALTLSMALFFQMAVEGVFLPQPVITPIPENVEEGPSLLLTPTPYINSLVVVAAMFVGSFALIALLRFRRLVRTLVITVFSLVALTTGMFYMILLTDLSLEAMLAISIAFSAAAALAVSSKSETAGLLACSYVASASGVIIGSSIPFWTSLVLLVAISVYDLLVVFKGHLRTLGEVDTSSLKGLVVDFRGVTIGLGDLFFYTVLYSFAMTNLGSIPAAAAAAGLLTGYAATLRLARKRPVFPGLPVTILTALFFSFTVYFVL
ncbi:MAG: hypothetical protein QXI02_01505 [Candidatus Caldarchaeum sp.]